MSHVIPNRRKTFHPHILVGLFAFFAAASVSAYAFAAILQIERPLDTYLSRIPKGEHHYIVSDGGRCIGHFNLSSLSDPGTVIKLSGEIAFSYGGGYFLSHVSVGGFFNSFGQLVSGDAKYDSPGVVLLLKAANPSPIDFSLHGDVQGWQFERGSSFAGPIVVKDRGDVFQLDYSALRKQAGNYVQALPNSMPGNFNIEFAEVVDLPTACPGAASNIDSSNSLNLEAIVADWQRMAVPFHLF